MRRWIWAVLVFALLYLVVAELAIMVPILGVMFGEKGDARIGFWLSLSACEIAFLLEGAGLMVTALVTALALGWRNGWGPFKDERALRQGALAFAALALLARTMTRAHFDLSVMAAYWLPFLPGDVYELYRLLMYYADRALEFALDAALFYAVFALIVGVAPRSAAKTDGLVIRRLDQDMRTLDRLQYWRAVYRSGFLIGPGVLIPLFGAGYIIALAALDVGGGPRIVTLTLGFGALAIYMALLAGLSLAASFIPRRTGAVLTAIAIIAVGAFTTHGALVEGFALEVLRILFLISTLVVIAQTVLLGQLARTRRARVDALGGATGAAQDWRARLRRLWGAPSFVDSAAAGSRQARWLFAIGAICVAPWHTLLISALISAPGMLATAASLDGGPHALGVAGIGAVAAVFITLALFVLGRQLLSRARRITALSYAGAARDDPRAPILYLRTFGIDHLPLPSKPHGVLPKLLASPTAPARLDEIVLDRLAPHGPVLAIGQPGEALPPFGAARIYVDGAGDEWKGVVSAIAAAASSTVICLDDTPGVRWELDHLTSAALLDRTLILTSPRADADARWAQAERALPDIAPARAELGEEAELIAVMRVHERLELLTAPRASRQAYAAALALFAQRRYGGASRR